MIHGGNTLSLSVLLAAGGVALSAAASLRCHDQFSVYQKNPSVTPRLKARAMYKQRSSLPINSGRSRSIPDGLISSPEDIRDNTPEYVDSGTHSSHHVGSPVGLDLNDPFRSVTGWLNHEGSIYNTLGLEGELNIIANSDEKPMGVKIGTLGYAHGDSVHNPFELLSETEAGTSVFLAPPELATSKSFDPSAFFTSHSMSMLVARSTPLGLGLLPNLNLTSVGSATSKTTESPNPVHVLIKARSPSSNSSPENLCATFYTHLAQNPTDDDSPMFLERCDGSFIPGRASNSVSLTTTQLWQYDPKTHELKPILQSEPRTSSKNAPSGEPKSTHSVASGMGGADREAMTPHTFSSSVRKTRTTISQPSTAVQQVQGYASSSTTLTPSSVTTLSPPNVRRGDNNGIEANDSVSPTYVVATVVEPYTLVFVPRTAPGAEAILPDSPV